MLDNSSSDKEYTEYIRNLKNNKNNSILKQATDLIDTFQKKKKMTKKKFKMLNH
jgi:hypothetical protein